MSELLEYFNYACIYFVIVLALKVLWSGRRWIRVLLVTAKRDLSMGASLLGRHCIPGLLWRRLTNETIFQSLDKICKSREKRSQTCFYYEDEKWTFGQVQLMSFQVANFFQGLGYRKGDVVGLAMPNRPEVVCIWLGLSRIGVSTALINFNLVGDSLEHCVKAAKCKSVIFGCEMREAFKDIWISRQKRETPQEDVIFYELDRYLDGLFQNFISRSSSNISVRSKTSISSLSSEFKPNDFASCLRNTSSKPTVLGREDEKPHIMDNCLYIFTSGTTGMPKTVHNSHMRLFTVGCSTALVGVSSKRNDITYCPLPLYHSFALGGIVWSLVNGIPLVIVPKFSASKFWSDVHKYKVTVCLYMGELCRFIVNQPVQPELEKNHTLRTMYGIGVKPEVWETFMSRFKIKHFVEVYGSTEGNCILLNAEGTKIGSVGYVPTLIQSFYSTRIIKVDEITGEIIRDEETGYAIECKSGEAGELVARIVSFVPTLRYEGYTDKVANEKKILRNLFRKGDKYFRSGDLLTRDELGYFYFKDRIGDTYRWKGENVSTAEVEGLILRLTDMKTTVVYGVKVPGTEGRCGMAAIVDLDDTLDLKRLAEGMAKGLPSYARPLFLRVVRGDNVVNMTGTFKLQKFNLQNDGFDIEKIPDPIFVYNSTLGGYQHLEIDMFKKIMQGNYRF